MSSKLLFCVPQLNLSEALGLLSPAAVMASSVFSHWSTTRPVVVSSAPGSSRETELVISPGVHEQGALRQHSSDSKVVATDWPWNINTANQLPIWNKLFTRELKPSSHGHPHHEAFISCRRICSNILPSGYATGVKMLLFLNWFLNCSLLSTKLVTRSKFSIC